MSLPLDSAPRRLYMDNAATSFPKPVAVLEAMTTYATEIGASAGRGGYAEAIAAAQIVSDCRSRLCRLFNGEKPEHFVFTLNCTDALNIALKGLIDPSKGGHVICSQTDHNSILRPLSAMASYGWVTQTRLSVHPKTGLIDLDELRKAFRPDTRLVAVTHVSNVTGAVHPMREIAKIAHEHGVPIVVDAAQSAGHVPLDLQLDDVDLMAAPGHKALLGPSGTGFLYVRPGLEKRVRPLREGGTGSISEEDRQPDFMPDRFETGSLNAIGIAGLSAGVQWVLNQSVSKLASHDLSLMSTFIEGVGDIRGLEFFGPQGVKDRAGVFTLRIQGIDPLELSVLLESQFGILTRSGLHCAPLLHRALGTIEKGGATRLSFGAFLSEQDVSYATDALAEIASQCGSPHSLAK